MVLARYNYTVKQSARAKHARLKMSLRDGLVVVVPKGFDRDRIPGLIERKKAWLEKANERIEIQRKFFEPEPSGSLPERLNLSGIGEKWAVEYRASSSPSVTAADRPNNRILIFGDTPNGESCKAALRRWLNRKTHRHVKPWLCRLAEENDFQLNRVLVKSQKTRWASCSQRRSISVNQKLLFIPEDLIRYVLIHELCHTVHLNHSREFWALLSEHDPDFRKKDEQLRSAWRHVPAWLDATKMRREG